LRKYKKIIELSESALHVFGNIYKRRLQSEGGRVCPLQTFCGQVEGGFPDAHIRRFLLQTVFRKLWCDCAHTDKGEGG